MKGKTLITKREYIENRVRGCCMTEFLKYRNPCAKRLRRKAVIDIDELMEFIFEIADEKKIPRSI